MDPPEVPEHSTGERHPDVTSSARSKRQLNARPPIPSGKTDSSLLFIRGTSPADLKSKKSMTVVRKKAMGSYLGKASGIRSELQGRKTMQPKDDNTPWNDSFTASPNYSSSSGYASPIPRAGDYANMFATPPFSGPMSTRTRTDSNASFIEPWGYPSSGSPTTAGGSTAYSRSPVEESTAPSHHEHNKASIDSLAKDIVPARDDVGNNLLADGPVYGFSPFSFEKYSTVTPTVESSELTGRETAPLKVGDKSIRSRYSAKDIDYSLESARDIKPPHSYADLIGQAILSSPHEMATLRNIYDYIKTNYAFFRYTNRGWQNSIRHSLSLGKSFEKVAHPKVDPREGFTWKIVDSERDNFQERHGMPRKRSECSPVGKQENSSLSLAQHFTGTGAGAGPSTEEVATMLSPDGSEYHFALPSSTVDSRPNHPQGASVDTHTAPAAPPFADTTADLSLKFTDSTLLREKNTIQQQCNSFETHTKERMGTEQPLQQAELLGSEDEIQTESDTDSSAQDSSTTASELSSPSASGILQLTISPKTKVIDKLMKEAYLSLRNFSYQAISTAGHGGSDDTAQLPSTGSSIQQQKSNGKGKRKSGEDDGQEHDDENGNNKRRKRDCPKKPQDDQPAVRYACPFYKRNPRGHKGTPCRYPGFTGVHRMKEHLYRVHISIHCHRCHLVFTAETELREHLRETVPCTVNNREPPEGLDANQVARLKSKKRFGKERTEEEKWRAIYQFLFPEDDATSVSPYCDDFTNPQDENHVELTDFELFCRREYPRRVRQELDALWDRLAQPIEEQLRNELFNIVQRCRNSLYPEFQRQRATASPSTHDSQAHSGSTPQSDDNITGAVLLQPSIEQPMMAAASDSGFESDQINTAQTANPAMNLPMAESSMLSRGFVWYPSEIPQQQQLAQPAPLQYPDDAQFGWFGGVGFTESPHLNLSIVEPEGQDMSNCDTGWPGMSTSPWADKGLSFG